MALQSRLLSRIPGITHAFDGPSEEEPRKLVRANQVHGDAIELVGPEPAADFRARRADGLMTLAARMVGVQTADCLPVLFASDDGRAVAAVHAGWRGLNLGILVRAAEKLRVLGYSPDGLVAAIGPAIGACCFEVNREVVDAFEASWGRLWKGSERPWHEHQPKSACLGRSQAPVTRNDLWIDLEKIARLQLRAAGLDDSRIEDVGHCTYCGPGELASYRRGTHEGVKASRQWSWILRT